jgi:hypothetical protein
MAKAVKVVKTPAPPSKGQKPAPKPVKGGKKC